MGRRGPRPKAEKVAPISMLRTVSTSNPQPPDALDSFELECWEELLMVLGSTQHLAPEHVHLCEISARTLATLRRADRVLAEEGLFVTHKTGYRSQHPAVAVSLKNRSLLKTLLVEMGATPLSRDQVAPPRPIATSKLENFLQKGKQR